MSQSALEVVRSSVGNDGRTVLVGLMDQEGSVYEKHARLRRKGRFVVRHHRERICGVVRNGEVIILGLAPRPRRNRRTKPQRPRHWRDRQRFCRNYQ